jgi:hypothetical protein
MTASVAPRAEHSHRAAAPGRRPVLPLVLLAVAVLSWSLGLHAIEPSDLDGWGLVGALSPLTLLAYPVLVAGGVLELIRSDRRTWVLALVTLTAVVLVYGLQPAVESAARLPVPWLHAGFSEYIAQNGSVLEAYDTRFSWPGFFAAAAMLGQAVGVDNPMALLNWAPVVLGGLAVLAMRALAGAVFRGGPAVWIATWVFLLANWTEQEYFSPQGTVMVLFLAALAVTARYLYKPGILDGGRVRWSPRPAPDGSPRSRIWACFLVIGFVAAIAPTHQLTPYVLVAMLLVLLLFGRLRPAWLPVFAAVPVVAWFVFGARGFWTSQLHLLTDSVGRLDSSIRQGISQRISGSSPAAEAAGGTSATGDPADLASGAVDAAHQAIVTLRIGITAVLVVLAVIGFVLLRRRGTRTWTLPALVAAAFLPAFVQPYGGEVFVRCYLLALPFLAIGAALALAALIRQPATVGGTDATTTVGAVGSAPEPTGSASRAIGAAVVGVVLTGLCLATVVARGGNDAYVTNTAADVASVEWIYANADPNDTVVAPLWYSPLRTSRVGDLRQVAVAQLAGNGEVCDTPSSMVRCIVAAKADFVVVNGQQDAGGVLLNGFKPGWTDRIVATLHDQHGYMIGFIQDGAVVLHLDGS